MFKICFFCYIIFDPRDSHETCRLLVSDTKVWWVLSIIHHSIRALGPLLMFAKVMAKTKKSKVKIPSDMWYITHMYSCFAVMTRILSKRSDKCQSMIKRHHVIMSEFWPRHHYLMLYCRNIIFTIVIIYYIWIIDEWEVYYC